LFREYRFKLRIRGETSLSRSLKASVDALKLIGRRVIFAALEPRIDLESNLSEFLLGFLWPGFCPFHSFSECLCSHAAAYHKEHGMSAMCLRESEWMSKLSSRFLLMTISCVLVAWVNKPQAYREPK
jgi:hypothetical protein